LYIISSRSIFLLFSFSGCGRSVEQTLNDTRIGKISRNDLPPIQVILGEVTALQKRSSWKRAMVLFT